MLYRVLVLYVRIALKICFRKIVINCPELLSLEGPVLFAANHPNSFLDGIILTALIRNPVYSLARGDAFANRWLGRLLHRLYLLPVYRTSEGVENLSHNYTTFAACQKVFAKGGIVLIFSEGRCVNEWHLRPLRKGTARLAISTWQKGIAVTVIPLGFNYSSFRTFGTVVHINFGKPLEKGPILQQEGDGKKLIAFNAQLQQQLQQLVYEINPDEKKKLRKIFPAGGTTFKTALLLLPALIGLGLHIPLYFCARHLAGVKFNNDHYDAVVVSVVMLSYPLYLLLLSVMAGILFGWMAALFFFTALPFCAWCCVQVKYDLN